MKIAIVGGGAVGLLFSYYMSLKHEVFLYVRNHAQLKKIENEGLILHKNDEIFSIPLQVKDVEDWNKDTVDLSIICVKQYHLPSLFQSSTIVDHPLAFVQNGMGHLRLIESLPYTSIILGSVEHGAYRLNENTVVHTGDNQTKIAIYRGLDEDDIQSFIKPFVDIFPFTYEVDYLEMLQRKLVVNAVINPLTAVLKVTNGKLIENPFYFEIVEGIFSEISQVLALESKREEYYENVIQVCEKTSNNQSSMLKDIMAQRQTENEAILGYLIEEGKRKNLHIPLLRAMYNFIKGMEYQGGGH